MELRLRQASAEAEACRLRAEHAESQLALETSRRVAVEQSVGSIVTAREALAEARAQLDASTSRLKHLEEVLCCHLFQQRAAEDRCLEVSRRTTSCAGRGHPSQARAFRMLPAGSREARSVR